MLRKTILAVLIYPKSHDGVKVLMLHRNTRPDDFHFGKYLGVGGKMEPDESPRRAAVREMEEETAIALKESDVRILGVILFPLFNRKRNEDWLVYVMDAVVSEEYDPDVCVNRGEGISGVREGTLEWIPTDKVLELPMWKGDALFLPRVLTTTTTSQRSQSSEAPPPRPFFGTIWYDDAQNVSRYEFDW